MAARSVEHRGRALARAKGTDVFDTYHEAVFEAIWQEGRNVGDPEVLAEVVSGAGLDADELLGSLHHSWVGGALERASGAVDRLALTRRPTFVFGDQRIVGTDAFEPSLAGPLEAFVERWEQDGPQAVATLEEDPGLDERLLV